jgi:hypothetical protein
MKIIAYEDANFETLSDNEFTVMYNPNTYSRNFKSVFNSETPEGGTAETQNFRRLESDSVSFEFLFDGTGASSSGDSSLLTFGASTTTDAGFVDEQIAAFFAITRDVNPDTHQPNFLQLSWGTFVFNCVMANAEVTYKLFHSSGAPLRATINATFKKSVTQAEQAAEARRQSPDLTHFRLVEEGETLPLIAKKVYGDPTLYLEIARINRINNFRKLKVGQQLVLPPIDKKENG